MAKSMLFLPVPLETTFHCGTGFLWDFLNPPVSWFLLVIYHSGEWRVQPEAFFPPDLWPMHIFSWRVSLCWLRGHLDSPRQSFNWLTHKLEVTTPKLSITELHRGQRERDSHSVVNVIRIKQLLVPVWISITAGHEVSIKCFYLGCFMLNGKKKLSLQ